MRDLVGSANRSRALRAIAVAVGVILAFRSTPAGVHPNDPGILLAIHDPSGKASMVRVAARAVRICAAGNRTVAAAGRAAARRDRLHAPWNYEPSRIGSHYIAPLLDGDGGCRGVWHRALSAASRARDRAVRAGRDAADLQRHRSAARALAVRRGLERVRAGRRGARRRPPATVATRRRRRLGGCRGESARCGSIRVPIRASRDVRRTTRTPGRSLEVLRGTVPAHLCGGVPVR